MVRIRTLSAGALIVAMVTSCVAPAKVSDDKDANGNKIEYVYYTPTGSSIPVRVRKDSLKLSDSAAASQEKAYTDLQRDANVTTPPVPGGK